MADDIAVTPGAGATLAADEIGGKLYVRNKLIHGADGTNDGDVSSANPLPVTIPGTVTVASHAVTNAGTFAVQAAQSGTWTVQPGNTANTTPWKVDGSSVTQPVSAASLPLPTGAATAAKQPALGTAGTASADVISIQGIASMTPVKVDGSGVTQPVSGTVTANAGSGPFPVSDNAGSLTVDAPVGTPVFVRLSDGSSAISALPVTDNGGALTVDNGGTFAVQVDGTALTRLTDIETNTDSNAVVGNGAAATAQRVTLANDSTGIVALTTSSATIGKLAANSGVDIGDVDVTSLPALPAGTNNIGDVDVLTVPSDPFGANADAASATGSISAKLRFIAATGIPITGTATVSGTVTANAGTNLNTSALALESGGNLAAAAASLATLDNVVSGNEAQVDVVAALPAGTNAIGKIGHDTTGLGHGVATVTTAGTDVAIASSTACKWVTIQAQTDNTSLIAVGATGVDATIATGTGIILEAGDTITIPIDNLADVFIDSLVNGEGVRFTYGT